MTISSTPSYSHGRVTVYGIMPLRKTDYLRSVNHNLQYTIVSCDMNSDDDNYPVYYLKATHTATPVNTARKAADVNSWYIPDFNIQVSQMRGLIIDMLPLVAAFKHYTHFLHHDTNLLADSLRAVNACVDRHCDAIAFAQSRREYVAILRNY